MGRGTTEFYSPPMDKQKPHGEFKIDRAFRTLKRNYGCPGPDGISLRDIKADYKMHRSSVSDALNKLNFKFTRPRKTVIKDYINQTRYIYVYNLVDRWVQQSLRNYVHIYIDGTLEDSVFAYRRGRSYNGMLCAIRAWDSRFVQVVDIKDYYSSINRAKLIGMLMEIGVPNQVLGFIDKSLECGNKSGGIPAGHCLSPILSNLYLSSIDMQFRGDYVRFSDDMFIGFNSEKELANIHSNLKKLLYDLGLEINLGKTKTIKRSEIFEEYERK